MSKGTLTNHRCLRSVICGVLHTFKQDGSGSTALKRMSGVEEHHFTVAGIIHNPQIKSETRRFSLSWTNN